MKKKRIKSGPTRAQLQARVKRLEADLQRLKRGDSLRREGEHWYRLTELFDATEIKRVPYDGEHAYLMGMLQDTIVVEVPSSADYQSMKHFAAQLRKAGIAVPPLFIHPGVRFLRLATVDEGTEAELDAAGILENEDDEDQEPEQPGEGAPETPGSGSESEGHGLGCAGPGSVSPGRDGGDRDHERERAGEAPRPAADGGGG